MRKLVLVFALLGVMGALSAEARTEAEAVDELFAVLGVTLPCKDYAVAWLADPPNSLEHRCADSIEAAAPFLAEAPAGRVTYTVDMRAGRERYALFYRFRGTAAPAVVLAQFLTGVTMLSNPASPLGRHSAPLIIYSRNTVPANAASAWVTGPHPPETREAVVFPR